MVQQRRIKVTRTVTVDYTTTFPEEYPNMTFEEAMAYEREMDIADVFEIMHGSENLTHNLTCEDVSVDG